MGRGINREKLSWQGLSLFWRYICWCGSNSTEEIEHSSSLLAFSFNSSFSRLIFSAYFCYLLVRIGTKLLSSTTGATLTLFYMKVSLNFKFPTLLDLILGLRPLFFLTGILSIASLATASAFSLSFRIWSSFFYCFLKPLTSLLYSSMSFLYYFASLRPFMVEGGRVPRAVFE